MNFKLRHYQALSFLGHESVNPMAKVSEQEDLSWADYTKEDIPLLLGCDAIYLLPDWADSKGARLEMSIALELGFKLIFENRRPDGSVFYTEGKLFQTETNEDLIEFRTLPQAA